MNAATPSQAETLLGLKPGQFPFASHFADLAGARLHYVDEGRGPVLFMVHGNPTWSFLYRKLIAGLAGRFRCIAVDLPGFGLSVAPPGYDYRPESHRHCLAALLDHLDIRAGTLVGHDWGGPIGIGAALAAPGRIDRFILGNTWGWPVNGIRHFEWFSAFMGGPIGRWLAPRYNLFVNAAMPAFMRRGPLPKEVLDAYRAPFRRSGDWTGTHVFPARIIGSRDFLAEVEAGIKTLGGENFLFLWPDRDIAFQARELARWQSLLPAATVVSIPRCGHYLWEEAAADAVRAIVRWQDAQGDAG